MILQRTYGVKLSGLMIFSFTAWFYFELSLSLFSFLLLLWVFSVVAILGSGFLQSAPVTEWTAQIQRKNPPAKREILRYQYPGNRNNGILIRQRQGSQHQISQGWRNPNDKESARQRRQRNVGPSPRTVPMESRIPLAPRKCCFFLIICFICIFLLIISYISLLGICSQFHLYTADITTAMP